MLAAAGLLALAAAALAQDFDPDARLADIDSQQSDLAAQLGESRNRTARLLTALVMFRRDPPPALIASPKDALDAVDSAILARAMAPQLAKAAQRLVQQQNGLALLRREVVAAQAGDLIRASQLAEGDALSGDGLPPLDPASPPPGAPPKLARPIAGELLHGYDRTQPGLMFAGAGGDTVRSPASGTVDYVGSLQAQSLLIILDLGGGYRLVLAGLQTASVKLGDPVKAGATLGALAQTPANLYLELRNGDQPVDPTALLR